MLSQKGDTVAKREGMKALKEICKKGGRYKELIKESRLVKNAVILLGGRRKGNGGEEERKEGEEGEEGREEGEEANGRTEVECVEMNVGEKISLIELLSELVKGGVEIGEEEEMKEVLMELEEEGNEHVEEEMEGEGEEKEEEKREWEELSENALNLVWLMEAMKARREGRNNMTLKKMKKEREEMEKKIEEERRRREEEKRLKEEANKKVEEEKKKREEKKKELEERICRMEREREELKKKNEVLHTPPASDTPPIPPLMASVITSLDETSVIFTPNNYGITREGNAIIHHGQLCSNRNCFIGREITSV